MFTTPISWRDRELIHLLVQPGPAARRTCVACSEPCEAHHDQACTCACSPDCPRAVERLAPAASPLPAAALLLAWELAASRAVEIVAVGAGDDLSITLRTASLSLPQLLARRVAELTDRGALRSRWRLLVVDDGVGPAYRLEPEAALDGAGRAADLARIADGLGAWMRAQTERAARSCALERLTRRERSVLLALLDGASVRTIARRSFVSDHTVRNHLKAIFRKLEVGSQDELRERFAGRTPPFELARSEAPAPARFRRSGAAR